MTEKVSNIDPQNIFTIDRSQLENRYDAQYYKYSFDYTDFIRLSKIANVRGGKRIPLGYSYCSTETPYLYLRVADINKDDEVNFNTLKYVNEEIFNILSRYEIFENDIAISIAGTIGKIILLKNIPHGKQIILTENCAKILIKDGVSVLPEYLQLILQTTIIQRQIELNYIQTTIPKLGLDRINNLWLPPFPPVATQKKIVQKYHSAFNQKQKKEFDARQLLLGIDSYILTKLGITLPKNIGGIDSRIFTANFSDITGERFDPFHNQISFTKTIESIHKGKYKTEILKHLVLDLKNGVEIRNYVENGGVRYLRVTDLDKTGLNNASPRFVLEQDVPEKIKLNKNCLLISRSGSLGLVNVVEPEIENSILSSHIFKVELRTDKILPQYLQAYLRSPLGQSEIFRNNNGGVIPEINQRALKSIIIPVPSINIQREMLKHINDIHIEVNDLHREAIEILEEAKQEVESMILSK